MVITINVNSVDTRLERKEKMGDFGHDEYTQGLLDTLERLKLFEGYDAIELAMMKAIQGFGRPDQLLVSPSQLKAMESLFNGKKKAAGEK